MIAAEDKGVRDAAEKYVNNFMLGPLGIFAFPPLSKDFLTRKEKDQEMVVHTFESR